MKLHEQWPAMAYLAALILVVTITLIATAPAACNPHESSVTCFREWISASGSIIVVMLGSAAAILAYKQVKAMERQTALAQLPFIDARISAVSNILGKASSSKVRIMSVNQHITEILNLSKSNILTEFDATFHSQKIIHLLDELRHDLDSIYSIKSDYYNEEFVQRYIDRYKEIFFDICLFGLNTQLWINRLSRGGISYSHALGEIEELPQPLEDDANNTRIISDNVKILIDDMNRTRERFHLERGLCLDVIGHRHDLSSSN